MRAWHAEFGARPTTVRKAVDRAKSGQGKLLDAMLEFPIEERGEINPTRLGWLLKKNASRIVGGMEFQAAEADERRAWRVVGVKSPPLPLSTSSDEKTVTD